MSSQRSYGPSAATDGAHLRVQDYMAVEMVQYGWPMIPALVGMILVLIALWTVAPRRGRRPAARSGVGRHPNQRNGYGSEVLPSTEGLIHVGHHDHRRPRKGGPQKAQPDSDGRGTV